MRLKDVVFLLGARPKPRTYGYEVVTTVLPREGPVRFALWQHPRMGRDTVTQAAVDALRAFLAPGDVCVDIGAHVGDTAVPMALAVGPTGCVLALEPNPYVYPVLEANAGLNPDKARIIPLPFAAMPVDGPITFEYSDAGFCNGGRHESVSRWRHGHAFMLEVQGRNLERILRAEHAERLPRLRFLKVDAEGYDLAVLRSLESLIRERRPYLMAEVYTHTTREQRTELLGFLRGLGCDLYRVEHAGLLRGAPVGDGDVMRWRRWDVFAVPRP
jgi:FkbM family methyltransferase